MLVEELLQQGDLQGALQDLQELVRSHPANAEYRIFLFQLLAVLGQWERAQTQLKVIGELEAGALAMVAMYRQVIACEQYREAVFNGDKEPVIFGHPAEWLALLVQALKLTAAGEYTKSQTLRNQAFEQAPATSGAINGTRFDWLADGDSRLGPVLEAIIEGRYCWIPLENIQNIVIEKPVDLRDTIWIPAHFNWRGGGEAYGVISARYPETDYSNDPQIALSKKTLWQDCGDGLYLGHGQKLFITSLDDIPLLETRTIDFGVEQIAIKDAARG